jgi:SOS response regulatory protein OraA/RecX
MDKLLEERSHTNREIQADMKNYEIEVQQHDNIINELDNHPVSNISNDEQVCTYNCSLH